MYEDFYPYIPGSLDAKQRMRKIRLKRLCYSLGAFIVFGSGFILGLAWHGSDVNTTQTALQSHHQVQTASMPPDEALTPPDELITPSLEPQPIAPPEPTAQATLPAKAHVEQTIPKAKPSPPPSVISVLPSAPARQPDQTPIETQAEASTPPSPPKPVAMKPKAPAPHKQVFPSRPYLVQVGAFRNEANARNVVAKLRGKGYQPFIRKVQNRQNHVLHRVFLDRAKDKAQAQADAKAFEKTEKMDALVMLADSLPDKVR